MKHPTNEKQFELASNAAYRKAGYWVHHLEPGIAGFPDTMVAKEASRFIEYKYIKPTETDRPILSFFQSTQPGQILNMVEHGIKVSIVVYCGGIVFEREATKKAITDILSMRSDIFLGTCEQKYYSVYLSSIE
jgi:hypothetical protein